MANSVKAIPDGYHSITPGLTCRDAARAIQFYKEAFGATEKMRMGGPDGKIMHAELQIGDSLIFVNDPMGPAAASEPSATVAASLYLYVEKADDVFNRAIAAGARINVPLQDMFWGDRYGAVIDPFGHHWGVASHIKDASPEEIERGQKAMLARMAAGKS
jgi:PhnB protein